SARSKALTRPDFSYDRDDYRPLGLALFETYVKPSPLPQRIAVGAAMPAQPERMLPGSGEAESLAYSLARGEGHRFSWEIDLTQVTLANFNYKKMSLVRDYNQLIDERSVATSFDHLFSIEPRALEESAPELLPSAELWGVVPADATQEAAVALARTGRSFIIQGPPGTGKSQTITNLIADYAARNKRVLFVCEKRAALDVVFNRLRLAGLGRLACLIHDSQEDKKAFVADLRDCYENWSKSDDTLDACRAARERTIAARDRHLGRIEAFEKAMTRVPDAAGQSLRVLVRRLIALPEPVELGAALRERLPAPVEWDAHRALAERLHRAVADAFGLSSLAAHPFARLSHATVAHERSYAEAEQMLIEGERLFDALDSVLEGEVGLLSAELTLGEALRVVQAIRQATGTNLAGNLALLDPQSEASADFNARREEVGRSHARLAAALEASSHWTDPLSSGDTRIALEQARRQETSLFKFLNGAWRRLKRTVRARYDFAAHAVEPSIVTVLEQLAARHEATEADEHARQLLNQRFGTTDGEKLAALRDEWTNHPPASVSALLRDLRHSTEPAAEMARVTAVADAVEALGALATQHLEGAHEMTLMALAETIRDLREALEDLPDLLPLLGALDAAGERFAFALRTVPLDPAGIEALVLHEAIVRAFREEPALQRFDAADLASSARRAARARTILQQDNGAFICAAGQHRFRSNVRRSSISVSQLDTAGREFKKLYTTGRRELEHEFGKTMRYRSIRDLADGETGAVASDLKPIWLMSPLSVSDTLPLRHDLFDVVIFDEASQIPTEEAVPALSRAPQVIVVGDEMQLPPTSFFSVTRDEEDTQVSVEEDGEALAIQLDADSLLNQAARTLPATLLAWHYRSRSEALISFSNAAFYDGRLITIPDRTLAESASAPEPLHSEAPEAAGTAVERMLARAISFHPVADGVYDKRTNLPEARLIAGMVRDLLARGPGPSIGIVAFSEAQQGEIESALEALAADDASFAARLEQEYAREDDGQINSLFVKNLENVQGDERDIILLSICYAPDRKKRMTMTFGPINQRGGEKRLNVIFSRARQHMAVVSTIRAEAITNTHNDGARALRTFLAFADAQSRGDAAHGQAILATLNPEAQRVFARVAPPDALRHAIAEVLRARGHTVQTDVGSASFRCDLAIVAPDGRSHALGILLDAQANGRTEDRYVFQPAVLRRFGWKVIDIPSNSWLRDEDAVLAQIEAALRVDPAAPVDDDPFEGVPASVSLETAASRAKAELADRPTQEPTGFTELRFQQGISDKFWKIAAGENDVTIVFGRMGTKGTTTVKTFETAERAKRETAKLIAEKLRKGYVEVSGSSTMTGTLSPELDASDSA
ncbi:MAG: AAA domain-containing protein, partial [Paraburkholderia sp.]